MLAGPSTGRSDPKRFFSGQEPSWSDIRDEIAPPRTIYNALFEAVFPGIADPSVPNSAFLVTGAAGTGKTTRYLRRNPNAMSRPYPNFIARVIHSIAKGSSTLACLRGPASNASNPRSVIKPATTSFAFGSSPQ